MRHGKHVTYYVLKALHVAVQAQAASQAELKAVQAELQRAHGE